MLNYIKADLYRLGSRLSVAIWALVCLLLPPVAILGAGTQFDAERIMTVVPVAIYFIFILASLMLTESIFGEDRRLGLYKNDTTSGISRTELFLSKYLTAVLSSAVLWALCSSLCALALAKVAGLDRLGECFGTVFSLQSVWWLLLSFVYAALFQTIRVLVSKTSMTVLIYAVISGLFSQIMNMLQKVFPALARITGDANISGMSALETVLLFILPLVGISAILAVGCLLFRRSEF